MTRGATVYGRGVIEPRGWLFIHSACRVFVELQSGKQMGAGEVLCLLLGGGGVSRTVAFKWCKDTLS